MLKSWNHPSFVNISPTIVIDTSIERSSRVLQHGNPKIDFFSKKFEIEFWIVPKSWNHPSFVNISPTIVIDTSIERSSRVLQHGNPKIDFFFSKKFEIEFWIVPKSWNHPSFVNISPTLVIDTSIERSSRVLQHGNIKICVFSKKLEIELNFDLHFVWLVFFLSSKLNFDLYFDLCQRDEIIQVGLNKHLYDDIGDASSSLRGSTSSSFQKRSKLNFDLCRRSEMTLASSISALQ